MIQLKKINKDNYRECLSLKVKEDQSKFVAPNTISLAQAYVFYEDALPYAIYNDEVMVGFIMLSYDKKDNSYDIWRFMIDEKYQGKGYGKAAIISAIELIKENKDCHEISLSYVPGNTCAEEIYKKVGFKPTGEVDGIEIVMLLKI